MERGAVATSAGTGAIGLAEINKLDQIISWIPEGIGKVAVVVSIILSMIISVKYVYEIRKLRIECNKLQHEDKPTQD